MMNFRRVSCAEEANADAIIVTLFLCPLKKVRGWMIGPIAAFREGIKVPYVAPSVRMLGLTAVMRAHRLADEQGLEVYIVDPGGLWDRIMEI